MACPACTRFLPISCVNYPATRTRVSSPLTIARSLRTSTFGQQVPRILTIPPKRSGRDNYQSEGVIFQGETASLGLVNGIKEKRWTSSIPFAKKEIYPSKTKSTTRRRSSAEDRGEAVKLPKPSSSSGKDTEKSTREPWQIQKKALAEKFGERGWIPRKKLSPDALDGIRSLHAQDRETYSTESLADIFKVSPEAIRRILKSRWKPNDDEQEDRRRRWVARGETIWNHLVDLDVKPPKKWRAKGITRPPPWRKPKQPKAPNPTSMADIKVTASAVSTARPHVTPLSNRIL